MSWVAVMKQALPEAMDLVKALVKAGRDPVVEIRRIRTAIEQRRDAGIEDAWEAAIAAKPKRGDTLPSPAPDTEAPDTDIYDD